MPKLTKARIIEDVAETNGLTRVQASDAVETLLEIIKNTLESGEDGLISGFGRGSASDRLGRNPATGERLMLSGGGLSRSNVRGICGVKSTGGETIQTETQACMSVSSILKQAGGSQPRFHNLITGP